MRALNLVIEGRVILAKQEIKSKVRFLLGWGDGGRGGGGRWRLINESGLKTKILAEHQQLLSRAQYSYSKERRPKN